MTDHRTLIAAAAFTAGARADLHNLGGLHADAHHAALALDVYDPTRLPTRAWDELLSRHLGAEPQS
ncbi:hypothetical protein [Rhodococcus sp. USK13]|uniref:hypothetical protein n=1 Tax=Rhodococcus sp. USK13 TaxID=2806442 RepID=UPI001BD08A07|nr:hypothetical protein [Rhodococcus sp. USK13]